MASGGDNYRGKIHSITINNFITYNMVKMYPGPFLNIIIGPNGTGKSTIVAAIVIGMGGNCQTLSRGKKLEDYVKNGKTKAAIAIEIYKDEQGNVVEFYRSFDLSGTGRFKIDKVVVTQKQYLQEVRKFNIQIDNLCQFLPQDRVQDFAKMNPQEIFRSTLKSVCPEEAMQNFAQLQEMEESSSSSGSELSKWRTDMKVAETQNEQIKVKIDNMAQRTKLQEKLQLAKVRKIQIDLDELTGKAEESTRDLSAAKKKLKEHETALAPIKAESQDYLKQLRKIEADMEKTKKAIDKHEDDYRRIDEEVDKSEMAMRRTKIEYNNAKMQKRSQEEDIQEESVICEALIRDVSDASPQIPILEQKRNTLQSNAATLRAETEALTQERTKLQERVDTQLKAEILSVRREIEVLENPTDQHINDLVNRFPDMCKAYRWLKENRSLFRGRVYNPIMVELKLKKASEGKFLENMVAMRDLQAFVCEDPQDMKLLVKKLTQEQRFRVNVIQSDAADTVRYSPRHSMDTLRQFGFSKFLLQTVDGPAPILNYLCRIYNLHNIPLGSETTGNRIDDIIAWGQVQLFFTPKHRYQMSKSKYSNATSTSCAEIGSRYLLRIPMDTSALERQRQMLEKLTKETEDVNEKIKEQEGKITANESKMLQINQELSKVDSKLRQINNLVDRMKSHQEKLRELKELVIDLDEEKRKFKTNGAEAFQKHVKACKELIEAGRKVQDSENKLEYIRLYLQKFHASNADLKAKLGAAERAVEGAQKMVNTIKERLEVITRKVTAKKTEIKSILEEVFTADVDYAAREDYRSLPAGVEELDEVIDGLQAQVDCMEEHNEGIIKEYEDRQRTIEILKEKINKRTEDQQKVKQKIDQLHQKWFPEVNEIIATINRKFSQFMASMNYAGEVALARKGEHIYSSYGIAIRVVYRNQETLQQLSSFLQSGGEKTVAIATYTLALQHLSQVPFRCVDEINQGMDPKNERKIFDMLIDETAQPGMSQYFFVTPKLLPNLKTNEYVVFHCVFNGPDIESPAVFLFDEDTYKSQYSSST